MTVLVPGGDTSACLPVIESLAKKGIEFTVASHKRICVGFFSRYTKHRELYPSPQDYPKDFIERLVFLTEENSYEVIMPVGEFVVPLLVKARHEGKIPSSTKIPLPDYNTFWKAKDKSKTMKIAMENNIPCPKTYFPSENNIEKIKENIKYPVLIKPCISHAAIGISIVHSKDDLVKVYNQTKREYGECIIQEFIPHTGTQYKAELIVDKESRIKAGIVYAKIRYYPSTGGSSTLDCTVNRRDILKNAEKMLKVMGWYGVADLDFIEDPRDGIPKLMEINPRFTRSIKIASIAGLDFPYIAYKVALGENLPACTHYRTGMYLRFLPEDILWFLTSSKRFQSKPSFFKFVDKNLRYEVISLNDPGSFLAFIVDGFMMLLNKRERKNILRLKKRAF